MLSFLPATCRTWSAYAFAALSPFGEPPMTVSCCIAAQLSFECHLLRVVLQETPLN